MRHDRRSVVWVGPQSVRPTALDTIEQLLRLLEGVLDATMPNDGACAPTTVREVLRGHLAPLMVTPIEHLAELVNALEDERELFDELFHASRTGVPPQRRAPELHAVMAQIMMAVRLLASCVQHSGDDALIECRAMDRAGAALLAGHAKAHVRHNMITPIRAARTPGNHG